MLEQLVLGHYAVAVAQQVQQHVEDLGFDLDDLRPASELVQGFVELELVESTGFEG